VVEENDEGEGRQRSVNLKREDAQKEKEIKYI